MKITDSGNSDKKIMKKRRGGIMTVLVIIIVLALLGASLWLFAETMKNRSYKEGKALLEKGDYSAAAAVLQKADRWSLRSDAGILYALGEARMKLGEYDAAKSAFEKNISLNPGNAEARYQLGMIYLKQKNTEAAKGQIKALEELGTDEARGYADELKSSIQTGAVKGFFNDLFKKLLPGIPDALKDIVPQE